MLKHYILALYEYNKFIEEHRLDEAFDFDAILCEIVASRPSVCSDTFDRFPDLRALAVAKVHGAFVQALDSSGAAAAAEGVTSASSSLMVAITIPKEDGGQQSANVTHAVVSSNLLHAAIILISNWQHRIRYIRRSTHINMNNEHRKINNTPSKHIYIYIHIHIHMSAYLFLYMNTYTNK